MNDQLTVYIANGTVLHHTSRWGWTSDINLFINGKPVPKEFPQALPPGATITAQSITNVLDHHVDKDGKIITGETYEAEQAKHRDHDGEFLSREDELEWRIYQKSIKPIYKTVVEDVKLKVVEFHTFLAGESMITCAPSYSPELMDSKLEIGAYFFYDPDEIAMLCRAITQLGMDMKKLELGKDIASSKYDGHFIANSDPHFSCVHAVTLEMAKKERDAQMEQVLGIVRAFKAKRDPQPLTRGEFYAIIEKAIHEFARCHVYAASKDVAGGIQRRLKELLRRMEDIVECPKCNSDNVECYKCIDCDNDCKVKVDCYKCLVCGNEWKGLNHDTQQEREPL